MKVKWKVSLACVGALIVAHLWLLLNADASQNECKFKGVTNEQHEHMQRLVHFNLVRPLPWDDRAASSILEEKVSTVTPTPATSSERIAAVHFVLRALGARFVRFDDVAAKNPLEGQTKRLFQYRYLLDVNRLFYFAPIFRNALVIVSLRNPSSVIDHGEDNLSINVLFPNLLDTWSSFRSSNSKCPPVPYGN